MLLRFPAFYRVLCLVTVTVPVAVVACSSDTTSSGPQPAAPSGSSTASTDPVGSPTGSSTTPPAKTADAGPDAADVGKDAAPPPTDVAGSAECTAYCAKMKSACNRTCTPKDDCKIASGQCAASTNDYLDCQTTQGSWSCGADGFSIFSSCKRDTTLCK